MSTFTQYCGIDVSNLNLDYCLRNPHKSVCDYSMLKNDTTSINSHFKASKFKDTLFILEHTGNYSAKLLHQLTALGLPVCLVNPLHSKSFMIAQGITNKNDKQAAYSLSLMGEALPLQRYKPPTQEMQRRKQTLTTLSGLKKQQRMLSNQLHAIAQLPIVDELSRTALESILQTVNTQIEVLEKKLYIPTEDPDFNEKKKYAISVKGIGEKTALAILLVTNGLHSFSSPDQVSKFLGLTPGSHYSGTSVRKRGRISKTGSNEVRALLYMCSNTARKYNNPCKDLYDRLRKKGKPHKVASVAVMHKLVKQVFACVTSRKMFDNDYYLKKQHDE